MKEAKLEPGLLNIFRWYVIVRGVFLAINTLGNFFLGEVWNRRPEAAVQHDTGFFTLVTTIELVLLFSYLSWPWLRDKLGKFFLPLGLAFAAAGLIFEQYTFSGFHRNWQPLPFLYILLILTAWQYRFSAVLIFGVSASALEIALARFFPPKRWGPPPFEPDKIVTYGRLAASLASYLVLGYVVNRLVQAQREQRQALADANLKLVQHAATVEQLSISRERNRLSRELHDTLAHTLSALAVQFDALATVWETIPDKARQLIEQMQATTRIGLDETRRALRALRASPLEELGLSLAIKELADDLAKRNPISVHLDLSDSLDDLPPEVEQCYYRVAQEAFKNVVNHAQGDQLTLTLRQNETDLVMTIVDDGCGFDVGKGIEADQLGLQGMRERARMIGAQLEVESSLGAGTTIKLIIEKPT